VTFRNWYKFKI